MTESCERSVWEIIPPKDRDLTVDEILQVVDNIVKEFKRLSDLPFTNYLFQLFSIRDEFNSHKPGKLYGYVEADGSASTSDFIPLFNRGPDNSQPIHNNALVPLTDPTVFSASTYVKICSQLYVNVNDHDDDDDGDNDDDDDDDEYFNEEYQVFNKLIEWDMSISGVRFFDCCLSRVSRCKFGYGSVYYILSKRAVEATIEVSFKTPGDSCGRNVCGKIVAYYGNFNFDCSPDEVDYYKLTLFEAASVTFLHNSKIPLIRSMLAVPYKCSLIIEACLLDDSGDDIFNGFYDFSVKLKDSIAAYIDGERDCRLNLKVDWKCEGATNV